MSKHFQVAVCLALLITLFGCGEEKYPGYTVNENDIYYKFLAVDGSERSPIQDDYLKLNVKYLTLQDSVIYDSELDSRDGFMTLVFPPEYVTGSFFESLSLLHEGDSVSLLLNATTFFSGYLKQSVPTILRKENRVKINLRLSSIRNAEEVRADDMAMAEELAKREMQEQADLVRFLNEQEINSSHYYRGLYIVPIDSGHGELPKGGDVVSIHFVGKTLDGKEFDSTYERDAPLDFSIGSPGIVIKGLEAGIKRMREGGKAKFIIPSHLAFGSRGVRGIIQPYTTLIYDVELIKLN